MSRKLIAFYSRAGENYFDTGYRHVKVGNTEIAAGILKDIEGADMFKIEQREPYDDSYDVCIQQAKADQSRGARPELVSMPDDVGEYDVIYLGYPNYWGTMPMAVFTFLEGCDLSGKEIRPFCTHEGSGMGRSMEDIRKLCPGSSVREGLAIKGSRAADSKGDINSWVSRMG